MGQTPTTDHRPPTTDSHSTLNSYHSKLAIDGGTPVRTRPFQRWPIWDAREEEALLRVLRSNTWGVDGEETERFEQEFAAATGARFALTITNGTAALEAALRACGVSYGDEVIVPPYTFVATAAAVLLVGAIPIFADIDPATYNIDPAAIERCVTPRTKAIIPVHIAGYPADMDAIMAIARRNGLRVIEDACQAVGARWRDQYVGTIGDMGCISFQSSKNINSGEGGAVLTDDPELEERCWSFKNCGRTRGGKWYQHDTLGDNFRLSQFQAAVLRVQLMHMEEWAERRAENGTYLCERLRAIGGLTPFPVDARVTRHAFHFIATRYDSAAFGGWERTRFIRALAAEGVPSSPGYIPVYQTGGVIEGTRTLRAALGLEVGTPPNCPVAERICNAEGLWLANQSALLGTRADMDDIANAVEKVQRASQA